MIITAHSHHAGPGPPEGVALHRDGQIPPGAPDTIIQSTMEDMIIAAYSCHAPGTVMQSMMEDVTMEAGHHAGPGPPEGVALHRHGQIPPGAPDTVMQSTIEDKRSSQLKVTMLN